MKKAIVTAGPQGAGKTTFCKEIQKYRPEITIIERDAILIELFGDTYLDPYTGAHHYCEKVLWERVKHTLSTEEDVTLILDTWLGWPESRNRAGEKLRRLGVEQTDLWYFTTSEDVCVKQFGVRAQPTWTSDSQREVNLNCCRKNFRTFHGMPIMPENEEPSFDNIILINPMQLTLIPYAQLLI